MIKNIIIACDYAYIEGGASKIAIRSAIELSKIPTIKVFFLAGCGEICQDLKESAVEVVLLGKYDLLTNPNKVSAFMSGIYNKKNEKEIEHFLNKFSSKDTILNVHSWTKSISSAIFAAAARTQIHCCVTVHDYFLLCPNGGFYNYTRSSICNYNPMSIKCVCCNCDSRGYVYKMFRVIRQCIQNRVIRHDRNISFIFLSEFSLTIL